MRTNGSDKLSLWGDQDGLCPLCRLPIDSATVLDAELVNVDHIVPLSQGGVDQRWNTQLTHLPCNQAKGNWGNSPRLLRQQIWRERVYLCSSCEDTILPSEVLNAERVRVYVTLPGRLEDLRLLHAGCRARQGLIFVPAL